MFGKLGRSGAAGRGPGKRPLSTPVQLHRPGEASGARPPIGASGPIRARHEASSLAIAVQGREETFRLEPGELDFGAIIRLTPDIVEEIRRLEAQGGAAKIKFDANANNPAGNVVDVGGKEFSFTWSRELTDLCDIYEERRNGDDGDGLLVECGAAWRKLNVQRILDESTKNHVKMRSEEAERMLKARKAIVLDPTNPSVKNQAKSMAAVAVEGNMRRMGWKHNKEMLSKKRKVENSQGAAALSQSKLVSKSATASNSKFNGIPSPVPSPQQPRPHALLSNSGIGKTPRGDTNTGAITPPLNINKEEIDIFVKEMPIGVSGESMQETNGYEERNIDPPVDLQNMLITLLSQNPNGMSFKALEQAIGEMVPNSVIMMENALKNIATLQTPGRYFLKQGRQVESSTRSFEGGSSPECSNKLTKRAASVMSEKTVVDRLDQDTRSSKNDEASDPFERIDIMQDTEDPFEREEKARDNNSVRGGSSSESGSDSDSESSSSGSDSGSQSRSKAGSGSASSSDSESDDSSSSKEASDEDVDIMTSDDEKGAAVQCLDTSVSRLSSSPRLWRSNSDHDIIDTNERDQKANGASPALDLHDFESIHEQVNSVTNSKNLPIARSDKTFEKLEAKTAESYDSYPQQSKSRSSVVYQGHNKFTENQHESPSGSFNNDRHKLFGRKFVNEEQSLVKDDSEQLDNHESVTKTNTKRSSNSENFKEKPQNAKRMKASSSDDASFGKGKGARSSDSSISLSPERSVQKDQRIKKNNIYQKDERREIFLDENLSEHANSTVVVSTGMVLNSPDFGGPPNFSAEQSGRKVVDSSGRKRTDTEKPIKYVESNGRANKHLQTVSVPLESDISALKNMQVDKISKLKGKKDENCGILDKYCAKSAKEIILGDKILSASDLVNRKSTDAYANEKGSILRRELSDLELGEFREPITDVVREDKRPFEKKNSFKKIENKVTLSDSNIDMNMVKCDGIRVSESKKHSPPILRGGMNGKVSADDSLDLGRSQSKFMQPQSRQSSKMDVTEPENTIHLDKCAESGGKNGTRTDQVLCEENVTSGPKKTASTRISKDDNKLGVLVCRKNVKRSKTDKLNGLKRSTDQGVDGPMTSNGTDSMKSLEFTSDEENAPYMKYKKAELDLKGPIKDFSMYKDYVHEYQEKYNLYCSLNKKLEKIRNYFLKVGDDLELARGIDMEEYYKTAEKLRQMYHKYGERHKEMKRIYIMLHEELKTLKQRIKEFAALHSVE